LVERRSREMGIARGCAWLRMPEKCADHWEAQSGGGANAREAVSQVMQSEVTQARSFANVFPRNTNGTQRFRRPLSRKEVGRLVVSLNLPYDPQSSLGEVDGFCARLAIRQQQNATIGVDVSPPQV
jgi:hypothetical protein